MKSSRSPSSNTKMSGISPLIQSLVIMECYPKIFAFSRSLAVFLSAIKIDGISNAFINLLYFGKLSSSIITILIDFGD
jgi:hypothetical protein